MTIAPDWRRACARCATETCWSSGSWTGLAAISPIWWQPYRTCRIVGSSCVYSLASVQIDTTTAGGRLVFGIFAALAEFERELIRERTVAGLKAAGAWPEGRPQVRALQGAGAARAGRDGVPGHLGGGIVQRAGCESRDALPLRGSRWGL